MYYFWVLVISFGVGSRLLTLISNARSQDYHLVSEDESSGPKTASGSTSLPYSLLKRYITVPAAFGYRCSQPLGWCTIPPRAQTLTIAAFVVLNTVLCCADYRLTDGNLYWPDKTGQLLRYVSDRTGIISLANFPLVWLFGMRNDVLMWLTGWGFGTYNAFHRWAARVATLQAIVHSIGYTLMIVDSQSILSSHIYLSVRLTRHRWRLHALPRILEETLLLEWRVGYCCHVSPPSLLILWHPPSPLRTFSRYAHCIVNCGSLVDVLPCRNLHEWRMEHLHLALSRHLDLRSHSSLRPRCGIRLENLEHKGYRQL